MNCECERMPFKMRATKCRPIKVAISILSVFAVMLAMMQLVRNVNVQMRPDAVTRVNRVKSPRWFTSSTSGVSPLAADAAASIVISQIRNASIDRFCLGWDVDTDTFDIDEWWTHHPGFVIGHQNSTHQCFELEVNPEKLDFLRKVHRNQFPTECDTVLPQNLISSGWGADFNALGKGLLTALAEQKPMIVQCNPGNEKQVWQYAAARDGSNATCASKDLNCYFLPITKCKVNHSRAFQGNKTVHRRDVKEWPWVYQYLSRGQQWIRRAVVNFVDDQRPPFPPNASCTVMHVRRGDVILQKKRFTRFRGYHPISDYLNQLPKERRQPGSNIFLLTDDANAIDEAREFHSHINWHWINRTRSRGTEAEFMRHVTEPTPKDEVIAILGTFEIAKQCDAVVRGDSAFGDFIASQVVDTWRAKGRGILSLQIPEVYASEEERMKSGQALEAHIKKLRASKGANTALRMRHEKKLAGGERRLVYHIAV